VRYTKLVYFLFLMPLFMTTAVTLIASSSQIQGQPMPEDECTFSNSLNSSTTGEDLSCKMESTSNFTVTNCFDGRHDGPTCKETQTPFVPSGADNPEKYDYKP
jgi:hypothetical protein